MQKVYKYHKQHPFVYEEQSIILTDQSGQKNTRRARLYTRIDEKKTIHFLFVFIDPEEIKGVAIRATRDSEGNTTQSVYIPALGSRFIESHSKYASGNFLGTDFSIESLIGEELNRYDYQILSKEHQNGRELYRVNAYEKTTHLLHHRHFILAENYFITKTEFMNSEGEVTKIQSFYDIHPLLGNAWHFNIVLMQNISQEHESLIKVEKRIYSKEYVPMEVFTPDWVYEHFPYLPKTQEKELIIPFEEQLESIIMTETYHQ